MRGQHAQLALVGAGAGERAARRVVEAACGRLHLARERELGLGGGVAAGAGLASWRRGRPYHLGGRGWRRLLRGARGRRRGRQPWPPWAAAVVQRGEVGHADGETVADLEGLSEARAVWRVAARLGAHVELGGQREGAHGAGWPALGTGRGEAGRAAGGGRAARYFRRARSGRGRTARALTVAAVLAEVLGGEVGTSGGDASWRRGGGGRLQGVG